ncbi:host attachment protein [Defluviimonas sp. WL0002]|uniref:Host attachment protein n=1 Tax=Albidovulum marisflavi TaxID=2984159 RepID=A0ABT2ZB61_9RHOB|nr:host attachment protein [Defluviimonas sp. WL0002]MCV2868379.1 host attachment protein [Defluviimonas sp. WL0002]
MKPVRTMIVIADDALARFVLNEGLGKGLSESAVVSAHQFAEDQVGYGDRPGRSSAGPGGTAKHGFAPHQSADEEGRARFARRVAEALEQEWQGLNPDRLILVAAPKMLGSLRKEIGTVRRASLSAELPKDLVKVPLIELEAHLGVVLAL